MKATPTILGIESSCDDTSITIINNSSILYTKHLTSVKETSKYNGIMPEIITQIHYNNIIEMLLTIPGLNKIDAIAVTYGPGLVGSLSIGVTIAKCISIILNKPLYAVNHLIAHMFALNAKNKDILHNNSVLSLVVSGAHSSLFIYDKFKIHQIGETLDDAPGEVFDKIARRLGYPYPGGPHIDDLASSYNGDLIKFPIARIKNNPNNFSFSGLKSSVMRAIEKEEQNNKNKQLSGGKIKKIAASFQSYLNEALIKKTIRNAKENFQDYILVSGGVAANTYLRSELYKRCLSSNLKVFFPEKKLCADNGTMVAFLGEELFLNGQTPSGINFDVEPSLQINEPFFQNTKK